MVDFKRIVAARLQALLTELEEPEREQAMDEVEEILQPDYSLDRTSPETFAKTLIVDNQDLQVEELQVENAREAETPQDLAESLLVT